MEDNVDNLLKSITGEDEYIFDLANRSTESLWTGFLSNRFSFWVDTNTNLLTVMSDEYSVTWEISANSVNLKHVVEFAAKNGSVSTFLVDKDDSIRVRITSDRLSFVFQDTNVERCETIEFGNRPIDVPRGWFNSTGPIHLNDDNRDKLVRAILGRPLNRVFNERLSIEIDKPSGVFEFFIQLTGGKKSELKPTAYLHPHDTHDAEAVKQCITDIMAV